MGRPSSPRNSSLLVRLRKHADARDLQRPSTKRARRALDSRWVVTHFLGAGRSWPGSVERGTSVPPSQRDAMNGHRSIPKEIEIMNIKLATILMVCALI